VARYPPSTPLTIPLGYWTTIVDAREKFLRARRYAEAADVIVEWPDG
jgi:hypothetical protein